VGEGGNEDGPLGQVGGAIYRVGGWLLHWPEFCDYSTGRRFLRGGGCQIYRGGRGLEVNCLQE